MTAKKYFTLEEANALLPALRIEIVKLQEIRHRFRGKYRMLQELKSRANPNRSPQTDPFFQLESELEFLQMEADLHIRGIAGKGAQLKDIDLGLVDFPSKLDEEDILLCWRLGEEQITYYHSHWDGFAGRRPL